MKMRMFMTALLLLAAVAGRAQGGETEKSESRWSVTPHVGTNLWFARYDWLASVEEPETMKKRLGLTAGVELGFEVAPRVTLSLGADYALQQFATRGSILSEENISNEDLGIYYKVSTSRGNVVSGRLWLPLQVGVRVWDGLSLRSGIQLVLKLHGNKAEWETEIEGNLTIPHTEKGTVEYDFERVHWYVPVGITYEYRRWVADLRYYFSLKSNTWTERRDDDNIGWSKLSSISLLTKAHDNMLQLTLGYRFSL